MTNRTALFTLITLLVLALGFTACGGDDTNPTPPTTDGELPTADSGDPNLPPCKLDASKITAANLQNDYYGGVCFTIRGEIGAVGSGTETGGVNIFYRNEKGSYGTDPKYAIHADGLGRFGKVFPLLIMDSPYIFLKAVASKCNPTEAKIEVK